MLLTMLDEQFEELYQENQWTFRSPHENGSDVSKFRKSRENGNPGWSREAEYIGEQGAERESACRTPEK
jgi:hypothetical protein